MKCQTTGKEKTTYLFVWSWCMVRFRGYEIAADLTTGRVNKNSPGIEGK